jgi:anaerobic ribonucleoside-triphosphate reductase activating protein
VKVTISRLHFPVTTLGPGRRIGIWFQGCSIRCTGCVSMDTWAPGKGRTSVDRLADAIDPWLHEADGLTISGGEPFDQPEALDLLLRTLRLRPSQDVLVYSGYPCERLAGLPALRSGRIDALITDPYVVDAPQTLPLRGSDNQRMHLLTDLGRQRFAPYMAASDGSAHRLDVMFDADGTVWLAGIPRPGDMPRLRDILSQQGHEAVIPTTPSKVS